MVKHSFNKILLALVAQFDTKLVQMYVKIASYMDLDEEIYMTQLEKNLRLLVKRA